MTKNNSNNNYNSPDPDNLEKRRNTILANRTADPLQHSPELSTDPQL